MAAQCSAVTKSALSCAGRAGAAERGDGERKHVQRERAHVLAQRRPYPYPYPYPYAYP